MEVEQMKSVTGSNEVEQMKSVTCSYASKWESSLQGTVCYVMQELWLRKIFPMVVNPKINIPENCVRMMLSKKGLLDIPEDSTNTYKCNIVNRYLIRRYEDIIDILCYASFLKQYQLKQKQTENYSKPDK